MSCTTSSDCYLQGLFCSQVSHSCQAVRYVGQACDPADVEAQCIHDVMTRLSATCDAMSRTCVGAYCR